MVHYVYFDFGGRGELSRLIAKVGGVENFVDSTSLPDGVTMAECGSATSVPVLVDGDLKMNESTAIQTYLASISPNFSHLTPRHRARDNQYGALLETYFSAIAGPLFRGKDKEGIRAACAKHLRLLEGILPESGFVNGLESPTPADLMTVVLADCYMPWGACWKHGEVDFAAEYPKLAAHAERTKAVKAVADALGESTTMEVAKFGM